MHWEREPEKGSLEKEEREEGAKAKEEEKERAVHPKEEQHEVTHMEVSRDIAAIAGDTDTSPQSAARGGSCVSKVGKSGHAAKYCK